VNSTYFKKARALAAELADTLDHAGDVLTDYVNDELSCTPYALSTAAKSLAQRLDEARDDDTMQEMICDYQQFAGLLRASALGLRAEIDRVAPGKEESAARLAVSAVRAAVGMTEAISENLTSMVLAYVAAARRVTA